MTIPIKPAATVILMREAKKGDFEIFMVKRSSRPPFGSLYVFPGGKLDPEDSDNDLYPCCEGMDDAAASRQLGIKDNGLSFWIACIRECFEEVGVLLANPR
jgi:8-oxo-dGTP pyrophosphatase MutT (NUDIX family)